MGTSNNEAAPETKEELPSLDEREITYDDGALIYVRRGSQKNSNRSVGKTNLNFNNTHLSKEHACFQFRDGSLYIKDCGSTFGTTINDKYIVSDRWHIVTLFDTIGFIVSKPSSWIAKIVSKFPNQDEIPLKEFSNPSLGLRLRFKYLNGRLVFSIVQDEDSLSDEQANDIANEKYETDSYYFDDCLEVGNIYEAECMKAEETSIEEKRNEAEEDSSKPSAIEPSAIVENPEFANEKRKIVARMEDYLLDCKDTEENACCTIEKPDLESTSIHDLSDVKIEDLSDEEDNSFGHFTSELISDSDSLSELSGSESESEKNSNSCPGFSSDINSETNSLRDADDSDPELDTSLIIEDVKEDFDDEDYIIGHKAWACENVLGLTDSNISSICAGADSCHCKMENENISSTNCSAINSRKRSFDEHQSSSNILENEHESKKIRLTPIESKFSMKAFAKEAAKGALYVLATIAALGVYGSTLDNQE